MDAARAPIKALEEKYHVQTVYGEKIERRTGASENMEAYSPKGGQEDVDYYGPGVVGKNKQTFTVKFDTGSSTFFVPGKNCPAAQCPSPNRYDESGTDLHNTTTVHYGSGTRSGENFIDTVSVAGVSVEQTQLVSLTSREGSAHVAPDSLMGLSLASKNNKPNTFFEDAIAQKKVAANEFSFYLGRTKDGTANQSEITIGGRDPSKFTGEPTVLPLHDTLHWNVAIDGFAVNGKLIPNTASVGTIDTGTTYIVGPGNIVKAVYDQIPGAKAGLSGYYTYPCSSNPKVSIQMGGKQFDLDNEDLALFKFGDSCTGSLVAGLFGNFIVGDTFLKSWYSIYSYDADNGKPAVLLAKANEAGN